MELYTACYTVFCIEINRKMCAAFGQRTVVIGLYAQLAGGSGSSIEVCVDNGKLRDAKFDLQAELCRTLRADCHCFCINVVGKADAGSLGVFYAAGPVQFVNALRRAGKLRFQTDRHAADAWYAPEQQLDIVRFHGL